MGHKVIKDTYRVEAIGRRGERYVALFLGPFAKRRAVQYAKWMNGDYEKYEPTNYFNSEGIVVKRI